MRVSGRPVSRRAGLMGAGARGLMGPKGTSSRVSRRMGAAVPQACWAVSWLRMSEKGRLWGLPVVLPKALRAGMALAAT